VQSTNCSEVPRVRIKIRKQETARNERESEAVESSLKQAPAERENPAYCFTLRAFATPLRLPRRERPASFFPPEVENIVDFPGEGRCRRGDAGEISKCSGIIKVYRFTSGRFSYANLAGGHPLGLFLRISLAASHGKCLAEAPEGEKSPEEGCRCDSFVE